ncbi:hypothetical protein FH972_004601 [Carpinus fangiana]|uniref:LYR motif-containing protein n=1 Tax=Carpinus fangiana TaxID=176857 RepID=A0A5N6QPD0_9ROSI|nr:hypothetical protein FH972_004601 [Carpinus fangiana]
MDKGPRVYLEILRLVRRLPKDTRPYYAQYLRENIVNYPKIFSTRDEGMDELFRRAYDHSIWVLNKYSVDQSAADKLKRICYESVIYYRSDNSYE